MTASVKRDYRSELRAAQAQETRRSIVAAASRLFVEDWLRGDDHRCGRRSRRRQPQDGVHGGRRQARSAQGGAGLGGRRRRSSRRGGRPRPRCGSSWRRTMHGVLLDGLRAHGRRSARASAGLARALEVAAGIDPAARELVEQVAAAPSRRRPHDRRAPACPRRADQRPHLPARPSIWSGWPPTPRFSIGWSGCGAGPPAGSRQWLSSTLCRQLLS